MNKLDVLRKDIDLLDKEICELLLNRFAVVKEIGEVKKKEGLPVTNAGREALVLEKVRAAAVNVEEKNALESVYRAVIAASKKLEE
ncbi:MAG TPA: hypothetical protein DIC18_03920 [Clostridiales bacterium]|nr:hypothetical protein [Clostridiales bacterium]